MSAGAAAAAAPPEPAWTRWLPLLLVAASLLPDLAAALPRRTYFFRDFTVTFLPLRLFAARELREGRLPFWNPYLSEGSVQLPMLYPPELLHALWPAPAFVSWLLTLHLPLAALGAYWLARELGCTRVASFASGVVLSLCGFTLSCLNLYVFLQALALAPFVAGLLRSAAVRGWRSAAPAALVIGLATATLAVEFVLQAIVLGIALAWTDGRGRGVVKAAIAAALGLAVAGMPIAVLVGLLADTTRGAGLAPEVSLGNALHPAVLLQTLLPNLFGQPQAPAEAWWGGRFFSRGTPYFLSIYCGPLALALGCFGLAGMSRRRAFLLGALAGLGVWYALGSTGGLAPILQHLPLARAFRFPSKALLLPHLVLALAIGFGIDRLRQRSSVIPVAGLIGALTGVVVALAAALSLGGSAVASWAGVPAATWAFVTQAVWTDALFGVSVAMGALLAMALSHRGTVSPQLAGLMLAGLMAADLSRAGAGLNRQVAPEIYELSAPLRRLLSTAAARGRVFSYGVDRSPAFARYLGTGARERTLGSFLAYRQVLGPYTNMIDGLAAAETKDLTAFAPRQRELDDELLAPPRAGDLVPWWRNAGVGTVLSLDELHGVGLRPLGSAPAGPPWLAVHVYEVEGVWPRELVACRVWRSATDEDALLAPYSPGFDPRHDVATSGELEARCTSGVVRPLERRGGQAAYETAADGDGVLVVRESWSRGWRATVDGVPSRVLRANGKHCAIAVPVGRHRVRLTYEPPGLGAGLLCSASALLLALALSARRGP